MNEAIATVPEPTDQIAPFGRQALPPGYEDLYEAAGVFVKLFERGADPHKYLSAHDWVRLCDAWNHCPK